VRVVEEVARRGFEPEDSRRPSTATCRSDTGLFEIPKDVKSLEWRAARPRRGRDGLGDRVGAVVDWAGDRARRSPFAASFLP